MWIAGTYFVPDSELEWHFVLAGGPGGQHVNKSSTAVRLSFDIAGSAALPESVRLRLLERLRERLVAGRVVMVTAQGERSQLRNRREAVARLERLLTAALVTPKPRRPTRPGAGAIRRRLEEKKHRAAIKRDRSGGCRKEWE